MNAPFTTGPERSIAIARGGGPAGWLATALTLDARLAELAGRPGDPALTRLRLLWWEEAVGALADGPLPVDPILLALRPLLQERPNRADLIARCVASWDEWEISDGEPVARARAGLLCDGLSQSHAITGLAGWAAAQMGEPGKAEAWLREGLSRRWPRVLIGQRLLARAALHRLEGRSERALALRLVGWSVSGS